MVTSYVKEKMGFTPLTTEPQLGGLIGLIGDSHGSVEFLVHAVEVLESYGCTSLVQLGDFGLIWDGHPTEFRKIQWLNAELQNLDIPLYVVLGNHENYGVIEAMYQETAGAGIQLASHITLLPRSGVVFARGDGVQDYLHAIGWLSGAASIDRSMRTPGYTWWPEEITTDQQAAPFVNSWVKPDVVLAHEALATPGLLKRLGSGHRWNQDDLQYARLAQQEHTERVLSVLDPAVETLAVSGHYHFYHSERTRLLRYGHDGAVDVPVRQVILARDGEKKSTGLLDVRGIVPRFTPIVGY